MPRPVAPSLRRVFLAVLLAVPPAQLGAQSCTLTWSPIENRTNPGAPAYCPGDTLRFTVCARNNKTSTPPPAVVIWDNFLKTGCFSGYTWVNAPPDRGCSSPNDACLQNFTITAGGTLCITFDATLAASFPTNPYTCYVSSNLDFGDFDPCMQTNAFQVGCSPPGAPDTRLTKTMENFTPDNRCLSSVIAEGDRVQWRIEAENIGSGADTNVVLTDDLPDGLESFRLVEPACTPCDAACSVCYDPGQGTNGRITANVGTMAPGEVYLLRFETDVAVTCAPGKWGFSNQARVTSDWIGANLPQGYRVSDNADGDGFNPESTCSGPIDRTAFPTATVTKGADRTSAAPGDTVHYTITVDAAASACAVSGYLIDDMPAGFLLQPTTVQAPATWGAFGAGPPSGLNGAGQVQAGSVTVAAGTSGTLEFDAVIDSAAGCLQPGVNAVDWALGDAGSGRASAPPVVVTNAIPDAIEVVKDVDRLTAQSGDRLLYTVRIRNLGGCPIADGTMTDVVPAGLDLDPASVTTSLVGPSVSVSAPQIAISNIDLTATAPGNELVVTFEVTVNGTVTGDVRNVATASWAAPALSASDDAVTTISGPPCPTTPPEVHDVRAVRRGGDVHLEWDATPNAATYNVFKVVNEDRTLIPVANRATSLVDPNVAAVCLDVPEGAGTRVCDDPLAVSTNPPHLLFYQVRGVCSNGVEGEEHPF